ncbi:hypothetical protein [Bordetella flabilis]|uniref:hypothetical protein n=1 Tax=Bordetella flabilis TaxID=463014 RepID=UPI000B0FE2C8|nr:hypothetical protein [Bordetella flabilis]
MASTNPKAVTAMSGWLKKSMKTHTGSTAGKAKVKQMLTPTPHGNSTGGGRGPGPSGRDAPVNSAMGLMGKKKK